MNVSGTLSGTFDVTLTPMESHTSGQDGVTLGRMAIEKTYHGALDAHSQGEMLSAMTATEGSAGYVAIEQVSGTLEGRQGSFVLQHYGLMDQGADHLVLEVIPDSGSHALTGLRGSLRIQPKDGVHHYEFSYTLPE